jgi:hypothetical protein
MGLGELLAVVDSVTTDEPWRLSDAELADAVPALSAVIHRLEAVRVAYVGEAGHRMIHTDLGYTDTATWLSRTGTMTNATSRRVSHLADVLRAHPEVDAAYQARKVCAEHARLVIDFLQHPPTGMPEDATDEVRDLLLTAARDSDTRVLRDYIARARRMFDAADPPPSEDTDRNELFASTTFNGRMAIKGDVDAETGEMLLTALSPLSKPRKTVDGERDLRPAPQRRADALTEILRRYLDAGTGPVEGGERPHLQVHINARDLADEKPVADRGAYQEMFGQLGVGRMPWLGPLSVPATRRIACDATVSPVVLDEDGHPVDLGRSTRVISRKLRRALVARDHGCAFPGCGRPPEWCDGHHARHWIDGGPTDLANLVLLCRFHHRSIHHSEWDVFIGDDHFPWFIPPTKVDPTRAPIPANNRGSPLSA